MSEEEKYSGKNFKANPSANKGERKQEAWVEVSIHHVSTYNYNLTRKYILVYDTISVLVSITRHWQQMA